MRCAPTGRAMSGRLGVANPKSHVDACVDRWNERALEPWGGRYHSVPYTVWVHSSESEL